MLFNDILTEDYLTGPGPGPTSMGQDKIFVGQDILSWSHGQPNY